MLLTGLHHSPIVSNPLLLLSYSSYFPFTFPSFFPLFPHTPPQSPFPSSPPPLTCTRIRDNHDKKLVAIIIKNVATGRSDSELLYVLYCSPHKILCICCVHCTCIDIYLYIYIDNYIYICTVNLLFVQFIFIQRLFVRRFSS